MVLDNILICDLCVSTDGSTFYVNDTPRAGNGDNASVEDDKTHHGSATLPGGCSLGSTHSAAAMKFPSEEGSECSSVTSESGPGSRGQPHTCHSNNAALSLKSIFSELQEHRENLDRMREKLDSIKVRVCTFWLLFSNYTDDKEVACTIYNSNANVQWRFLFFFFV